MVVLQLNWPVRRTFTPGSVGAELIALLIAGLLSSGAAKPLFASHYAATWMEAETASGVIGRLPLFDGAYETSLWLEKAVEKM